MQFTAVLASFSALAALTSANRSCHGQTLYCGHTLTNGLKWSNSDIAAALVKGEQAYPDDLANWGYDQALFECDGRSGDDALWYRSYCADAGCHDAGSGHSDYCR
jgi:hypothetical protein